MKKKCTIEAKVFPITRFSGHLYLEVFGEDGQRIAQVNGFSTDAKTRKPKPVGFPGDLLMAYLQPVDGLICGGYTCRDAHPHKGEVLFEGAREDVMRALSAMEKRAGELNRMDLPYKLLSFNSNTIFAEMVKAAQTEVAIDAKALEKVVKMKPVFPGLAADFNRMAEKIASKRKAAEKKNRPRGPDATP